MTTFCPHAFGARGRVWLGTLFAVAIGLSAVGCGEKVKLKEFNPTEGVAKDDVAKVKQYLEDAGIKGDVMKIEDYGEKDWLVMVNTAAKPEPGVRPSPSPPKSYTVEKATGKIGSTGL
jgi:hypothetical protein